MLEGGIRLINAEKLRTRRKDLGLTQRTLADKAKIACRNLARLENNEGDTTTGVLLSLAKELDCSPLDLLIDVSNPTPPLPRTG